MKCDKRLAVAKEHKSVDREAFLVDCGEAGRYSDPATIRTRPLLMNWPPDPGHYSSPASIRTNTVYYYEIYVEPREEVEKVRVTC